MISTTICIPYNPTLEAILQGEKREQLRSKAKISRKDDSLIIEIEAKDIPSLRASTNAIMQAIAVHDSV